MFLSRHHNYYPADHWNLPLFKFLSDFPLITHLFHFFFNSPLTYPLYPIYLPLFYFVPDQPRLPNLFHPILNLLISHRFMTPIHAHNVVDICSICPLPGHGSHASIPEATDVGTWLWKKNQSSLI